MHRAGPRRQRARHHAGPAGGLEPALARTRAGELDQRLERLARVGGLAAVEALRLVGELAHEPLILHLASVPVEEYARSRHAIAAAPSKVPFYIAGGALALWAVLIAVHGITPPGFPGSKGGRRGVIGASALLVLAAMWTAVVDRGGGHRGRGRRRPRPAFDLVADPGVRLQLQQGDRPRQGRHGDDPPRSTTPRRTTTSPSSQGSRVLGESQDHQGRRDRAEGRSQAGRVRVLLRGRLPSRGRHGGRPDRAMIRRMEAPAEVRAAIRRGEWTGPTAGAGARRSRRPTSSCCPRPTRSTSCASACATRSRARCSRSATRARPSRSRSRRAPTCAPTSRATASGATASWRTSPPTCATLWREDLVAFLIGCSFTFERALLDARAAGPPRRAGRQRPDVPHRARVPARRALLRPAGRLDAADDAASRPSARDRDHRAASRTSTARRCTSATRPSSGSRTSARPTTATRSSSATARSRCSGPAA